MKITAVIPARYGSSRLPGKPLVEINKKPLIQYVYERVLLSSVDQVIVATDDERIASRVRQFGGEAVLTATHHRSGTERVAEVAATLESDIIVNVQGDEPLIPPEDINRAIAPLQDDSSIVMTTLVAPLTEPTNLVNPHVVKVAVSTQGFALYFSRSPIPFPKHLLQTMSHDIRKEYAFFESLEVRQLGGYWQHVGLYAFRRDFLLTIPALQPGPLERQEDLEQLRVLEHGYAIKTVITSTPSISIDTPEDLQRLKTLL